MTTALALAIPLPLAVVKVFPIVGAVLVVALLVWRFKKWSIELKGGAILVAAGLAVYGSGLVEIPNLEELIESLGRTLGAWTYLLVGALAFLETGAFVGFIAPGEFTIIFGGVVAGQGEIDVIVLLGIVFVAATAGDSVSFFLGRKLGRGFLIRHGSRVKITEERLQQVEKFYGQHGGKMVLIGRFVGVLRALGPFIAGAGGMRYGRFLPFDVVGAIIWSATFVFIGYIFWQSFDQVTEIASRGAFALGAVIVVVGGAFFAWRYLRVAENRETARHWLDEQSKTPVGRPIARVAVPFYRRVLTPIGHALSGPGRFIWERLTPGGLGLELTTLSAILLVSLYLVILLAFTVEGGNLAFGDRPTLDFTRKLWTGWSIDIAEVVSFIGKPGVIAAVVVAATGYVLWRRRIAEGIALAVGYALISIINPIVKELVERPRPPDPLQDLDTFSYPSTHAAQSIAIVAVAVVLSRATPKLVGRFVLVGIAIVVAGAIGLSRAFLHVHYLSDVVGGWALGAAVYGACGIVALLVGYFRHNPGAAEAADDAAPVSLERDAEAPSSESPAAERPQPSTDRETPAES